MKLPPPLSSSSSSTSSHLSHLLPPFRGFNYPRPNIRTSISLLWPSNRNSLSLSSRFKPSRLATVSASTSPESMSSGAESPGQVGSSESAEASNEAVAGVRDEEASQGGFHAQLGNPSLPIPSVAKLSLSDQAFFLLAFIACTVYINIYVFSDYFSFITVHFARIVDLNAFLESNSKPFYGSMGFS